MKTFYYSLFLIFTVIISSCGTTNTTSVNPHAQQHINMHQEFQLNNVWMIQQVNGKELHMEDFKTKQPQLEINISENKAFGNDGCNGFQGSVGIKENTISFGDLASTMIACPDMDQYPQITQAISGKTLIYKIEKDELYLLSDKKVVMVLKMAN